MTDKELEIGKIYKIDHRRRGIMVIKIIVVTDDWIEGVIIEGEYKGDEVALKREFIIILEGLK